MPRGGWGGWEQKIGKKMHIFTNAANNYSIVFALKFFSDPG